MKEKTVQDIKNGEEEKTAKEYVQCTLQTDTRQQMRYKKMGKEIHDKKENGKNKKQKQCGRRGWVSKHGYSTRIWFGKKMVRVGRGRGRRYRETKTMGSFGIVVTVVIVVKNH